MLETGGDEEVEIIFPGKIRDYQRGERKLPPDTPNGPRVEREGKLRNALGRQVGSQAGRYWALYFHKLIFTRQYTRPCPLLYGPRKYSGPPGIGWQGGRVFSPVPSNRSLFLSFHIPRARPHPAQRHKSPPIVNNTRRMLIFVSTYQRVRTYVRT